MPTLRVTYRQAVFSGQELVLDDTVVVVGRDPSSQVRFDETAERIVSRRHAEIRWGSVGPVIFPAQGKVVMLRDQQLSGPTPLASGDIIVLAGPGGPSFEVSFEVPSFTPVSMPPAAKTEEGLPPWQMESSEPRRGEATIDPRTPAATPLSSPSIEPIGNPEFASTDHEGLPPSSFAAGRYKLIILGTLLLIAALSIAMAWWTSTQASQSKAAQHPPTHR